MTITPRVTRRGSRLDWVKFDFDLSRDGSVDPTDKALYAAIASFVDLETRESPETVSVDLNAIPADVPTRKRLAACIGRSVDTVDRATKRLEDRGLLRVHRQPDPTNPKVMLPSEYELLDHELWDQRAAERAAARAARRQGAGVSAGQGGGRMGAATPGRAVAATPGRTDAAVKDEREVEEEKGGEKTPDGRQASTGSKGSSTGGSAASGKSKPPSYTSDQRHRYNTFVAALPAPLKALVPNGLPKPLVDAVLAATDHDSSEGRTVEQLIEFRLLPKWDKHYSRRDQAGPIEKPVGVLVAMLRRDHECQDPRCDERTNVDTGLPCISCEQRLVDKRAERAQEAVQEAPPNPAPAPAPRQPRKPVTVPSLPAGGSGGEWAPPNEQYRAIRALTAGQRRNR
ncbi:helix-turn-helix domain-containing protein [Streptomyces coelicolor]|nr:helix-turn-helix domain-containing protein [Streptomyces coelicolor]